MSVMENLELGAYSHGKPDPDDLARVFGLSPILVDTIFQIIQDINGQGTTVLLVEQNALKALAVANRGYVIQTGQIVLSGTARELLGNDMVRKAYHGDDGQSDQGVADMGDASGDKGR